jgi:hypothetical protein
VPKPPPVERSKGGWRRKARRITPATVANYWAHRGRLDVLRATWPGYLPTDEILARINRFPSPKPVTVWQCKLMASRLKLRRPSDLRSTITIVEKAVGKGNGAIRLEKKTPRARKRHAVGTVVEPDSILRKVGRKPKLKRPRIPRLWSVGLGMGRKAPKRGTVRKRRRKSRAQRARGVHSRRQPAIEPHFS